MKHMISFKRILALLLLILLAFILVVGMQRKEVSSIGTNEIRNVLLGNAGFFETDIKEILDINQLNRAVSSDSTVTAETTKFTIVDLDNDGTNEVILWLVVNGLDDYGNLILRYQNGKVYGYVMWVREFNQLKEDGSFSFSSGASDSGFGKISFIDQTYSIVKSAYSQSSYDSDQKLTVSYFINNASVTQEEFELATKSQHEKQNVTWYDFTNDNIDLVYPGL